MKNKIHRLAKAASRLLSDVEHFRSGVFIPVSAIYVFIALCILANLYVVMSLNQSSLTAWEEIFPAQEVHQMVEFGEPKKIRSDEWNTLTPWVLGQATNGFLDQNVGIGGSDAPTLATVPVSNPVMLVQPKYYGFFLLDKARGFSWFWAYKTFALLFSCFMLFGLLTRGNTEISVLGSLLVYFSSFTQWWFSSNLAESLTAFFIGCTGIYVLLLGQKPHLLFLGALMTGYGAISSLLHVYPPFQIPLIYVGIALAVGMVGDHSANALDGRHARQRIMAWAVAGAFALFFCGLFLWYSWDAVTTMRSTVYPGNRVSESGELHVLRMFAGPFQLFSWHEGSYPAYGGNASEASSYIIYPPLLVLLLGRQLLAQGNRVLLTLGIAWILVFLWVAADLPSPIERLFQFAGWSMSPPARAVIGLGISSLLIILLYTQAVRDGKIKRPSLAALIAGTVLMLGFYLIVAWHVRTVDPAFFTWTRLLCGMVIVVCVHVAMAFGMQRLLWVAVLLQLPHVAINPLTSGIAALADKPVLRAARAQTYTLNNRWAVVGSFVMSQGLKAQGLNVITGSQLVPNAQYMRVFDPTNASAAVWNRYAHIILISDPSASKPIFDLMQPDLYTIRLNICGPELDALHVTRMAYTEAVPEPDRLCLEPLWSPPGSGVGLYKRRLLPDMQAQDVD